MKGPEGGADIRQTTGLPARHQVGRGARLEATIWLAALDDLRVRRLAAVKSATYYRLAVRRDADAWRLTAYLDV